MNKENFYTCKNEHVMMYILLKEDNWDILEAILGEVFGEKIKVTDIINRELIENNIFERERIADVLIESTNKVIEIELNVEKKKYTRKRNSLHLFNIYQNESLLRKSLVDDPDKLIFYQINLTYGLDMNTNIINKYSIYNCDIKEEEPLIKDLMFYEINMSRIDKMSYDNTEKDKYKYLRMLNINKDKLSEYCKGDKLMEKYERELIEFNKSHKFKELNTYEQEQKLIENTIREDGFTTGVIKNEMDTAAKMLDLNIDVNTILEVTGLSNEYIEMLR